MNPKTRPRILVVDDDRGAVRTLTLILERKGFDVVTAGSVQEALTKAQNGPLDVGLLDIRLPDGKGVQLLKPLKSRHPDMEMIMVTGYASTDTAMSALNEGATAYITKPLNMDEVLLEVNKILRRQRLVTEKRDAEKQVEAVNAVLRAIRRVNQLIVREEEPEALIQGACDSLMATRGYVSVLIALQDGEGRVSQVASTGLEGRATTVEQLVERGEWPTCGRRALDEREVVIQDVSSEACGGCPSAEEAGIDCGIAAPLQHGSTVYGVLMIDATSDFAHEEEISLIGELANDIALGLRAIDVEEQRARIHAELERHSTQLEWLTTIQSALSQARSAEDALRAAAMAVDVDEPPSRMVLHYVETDERGQPAATVPAAVYEDGLIVPEHPSLGEREEVRDDPLAALWLASPHNTVFVSDVREDERADDRLRAYAEERGFRSTMLMSLHSGGRWQGVMTAVWPDAHTFSPEERFYCRQLVEPLAAVVASRRAYLAQQRSETRYKTLFNSATDATLIHDLQGDLLAVNDEACQRLGYDRHVLEQMTIWDITGAEQAGETSDWTGAVRKGGRHTFEGVLLRRDDREVPVEVSSRLIEYGRRRAVLSAARDISERLEMESRLHQQERLAAVGQLAGGIAHDFRNFLTTIILYAGMPMSKPDLSQEVRDALEVVAGEARQAAKLVQQILDFSGRSEMETEPVDLVGFVEEAVDILRQTIPESIHVNVALEPTTCLVKADPTRIQQVLMNLALNARDAMTSAHTVDEPQGGELGISLSTFLISPGEAPPVPEMLPGEWVRLTVSDTGTGMTEEVKERIFEPFFTTKARGEGTGLGLAQVYGIVQQHQGHIDVVTKLGKGTSFHVYLPVHAETAVTDVDEEGPTTLSEGAGEMILLVEDQANLREAGREILSSLGYRVLTAANGIEALEMLEAMEVDLVLTDVVMPDMGGKALMRELEQVLPHLPVVAMTGYTMGEELRRLRDAGFVDVIQKPFDAPSLAQAARHALDGVQA